MDFMASRWAPLQETSPSGKSLFRCTVCQRTSVAPDKTCEGQSCHRHDELVIHRYFLPSIRGEGWAIVYITSLGEFLALSDWGNYGYWWSHHGMKDIRQFFLRAKESPDYFIGKLSAGADEYDGEQSYKSVKDYILEVRRDRSWPKERARDEWDLLNLYDKLHDEHDFQRWYSNTRIDEAYEHHRRRPNPQVVAFVEKVLGRLDPILRAELTAEGLETK
jgi:hypothetical protein